jgi:hypothetical protein
MRTSAALLTFILAISAMPARAQERGSEPRTQSAQSKPARHLAPSASLLFAPMVLEKQETAREVAQPALSQRDGFGLMIAGGALFVAGVLVGGDAGTIMAVAGAGAGAYGMYLYFR